MAAQVLHPFQRDAFDTLIEDILTFEKGSQKGMAIALHIVRGPASLIRSLKKVFS